jgi:hypothetical protein
MRMIVQFLKAEEGEIYKRIIQLLIKNHVNARKAYVG